MSASDLVSLVAKKVLGPDYGGPSLGYDKEKDQFLVYSWGDAPVGTDEISRADSVFAALKMAEDKTRGEEPELTKRELSLLLFLELTEMLYCYESARTCPNLKRSNSGNAQV